MKVKKILGWISLVLVVFIIFLGVKALLGINKTKQQIDDATFVSSAIYNPDNEGKIIIVPFNIKEINNACDTDIGITFNNPVIKRHVEKLVPIHTAVYGHWEWEWRLVIEQPDEKITNETFAGSVQDGLLKLDSAIEKMIPVGEPLHFDDLTDESKSNIYNIIGVREGITKTYFSNASYAAFSEKLYADDIINPLFNDEGKIRIWYEGVQDKNKLYSIIGEQKGDTLFKSDTLDVSAVNDSVVSKKELFTDTKNYIICGVIGSLFADAILCYFALKWIGVIKIGIFERLKIKSHKK